jgi:Coenzyme PQQ synthesis protein D (PqqD)
VTVADETWLREPDLAAVASEDRVVVLRLTALERPPLILEGSAAAIWAAVEQPRTLEEIAAVVAAGFGSAPADIARDVARFLGLLEAEGLVARRD